MDNLIQSYIKDHSNAWAETTQVSEAARLRRLSPRLARSDSPESIYNDLKETMKPYSVNTLFVRLAHFYQWLIDNNHRSGENVFMTWKKKNARLFRYSYQREKLEVSFSDASRRVEQIEDVECKLAARVLLNTGLRISELSEVSGDYVVGKGGKRRKIFFTGRIPKVNKKRLYRSLKKVGLKPHSLRKLFATRVAKKGARPEDLCEIMGWSSINTAFWYLQPKRDDELKRLVE